MNEPNENKEDLKRIVSKILSIVRYIIIMVVVIGILALIWVGFIEHFSLVIFIISVFCSGAYVTFYKSNFKEICFDFPNNSFLQNCSFLLYTLSYGFIINAIAILTTLSFKWDYTIYNNISLIFLVVVITIIFSNLIEQIIKRGYRIIYYYIRIIFLIVIAVFIEYHLLKIITEIFVITPITSCLNSWCVIKTLFLGLFVASLMIIIVLVIWSTSLRRLDKIRKPRIKKTKGSNKKPT